MSENGLKDNLDKFKEKIKEEWNQLSDNDRSSLTGDIDQLANILQQRLGYAKEKALTVAQEFVKDFKETYKNSDNDGDSKTMNNLGKAAEEIGDIGKEICDKTIEMAKNVKEDASKYGKAVTQFVKDNPYSSMAIAACTGLVLSFLVRKN